MRNPNLAPEEDYCQTRVFVTTNSVGEDVTGQEFAQYVSEQFEHCFDHRYSTQTTTVDPDDDDGGSYGGIDVIVTAHNTDGDITDDLTEWAITTARNAHHHFGDD